VSTYWGYACVSHEPPIVSEHWFNHGDEALAKVFCLERAGEWPVDDRWPELGDPVPMVHRHYETTVPIVWLREHPNCTVVLHNEYGDTKPVPGDLPPP